MKKIPVLLLILSLCLFLGACGESGTAEGDEAQAIVENLVSEALEVVEETLPEEVGDLVIDVTPVGETQEASDTETEATFIERPEGGDLCWVVEAGDTTYNVYCYYSDDGQVYACVSAVLASDGSEIWNYVTEPQYVGQLDNYTIVGPTTAGFVFVKEDVVYCLNPVDGSLEWTSEPMGDWPAGYFAVDDSCNFYFPGYFSASLTVLDAGGCTVHDYDQLQSMYGYTIEDGWCEGIALGDDGMLRMKYCYEISTTYVIDPETGCSVDEYLSSVSVEESDLIGNFMDISYSGNQNMILTVDENLNYSMTTYDQSGEILHSYEGYLEIGTFAEEVGRDLIVFHLTSTDDVDFEGWENIGEYVPAYIYREEGTDYRSMELIQVNNGDSVLSIYFEITDIILESFEAMG